MKKKFLVEGMTCAACQAHVDKAVRKLDGVSEVNVNLLQNTMEVNFDEKLVDIFKIEGAVSGAGYRAFLPEESKKVEFKTKDNALRNLIVAFIFLIILMYVSMGHMIGIPLLPFLDGQKNALAFAFTQFLLTIPVLIIYRQYFISGFKKLFKGPNMDSLIAVGSSAALIYGIVAIYLIGYGLGNDNLELVNRYRHNLYFESATMILTLVSLGKYLEGLSKRKTTSAIEKLVDLAPKKAILLKDGLEVEVEVEEVKKGDIIIVKKGMAIPVDGKIIKGSASINQANITGESLPVLKNIGAEVYSSTIITAGMVEIEATKVGEDSSIQTIIKLVSEASNSKAPISKLADKISLYFVPIIFLIALIVFIIFISLGYGFELAFNFAISVLVIACPCALGLATPVAIMVGTGKGAQSGLLIKNAEILEKSQAIKTVVLDKTGTITVGEPEVYEIISDNKEKLLEVGYSLENNSEHPLAQSIIKYAKTKNINLKEVKDYESIDGKGLKGKIDDINYYAGNYKYLMEYHHNNLKLKEELDNLSDRGATPLIFFSDKEILGIIAVKDKIKETAKEAIRAIQDLDVKVVMLTGDNYKTAMAVAKEVGIKEVISDVHPVDKAKVIKNLKNDPQHLVAMVGDGVNDALALTEADLGIAIGAGSDVAIESADIVLQRNDLIDVSNVIRLSKRVINTIKGNLFWAFFYNCIGIILAAGVFYPSFGISLNPMYGSLAMSFSSVFVVLNALTINFFKIRKSENNLNEVIEEEKKMQEVILNINGMMCNHCVNHVKKALESLNGVTSVEVSLEKKMAVVKGSELDAEKLVEAVTNAGYEAKVK